jgi:palmitoyltransferase
MNSTLTAHQLHGMAKMMTKADQRQIVVNVWAARIIPWVLAGVVGYATYVTVALLCGRKSLVEAEPNR